MPSPYPDLPHWISYTAVGWAIGTLIAAWALRVAILQLRSNRASLVVPSVTINKKEFTFTLRIVNGGRSPAVGVRVLVRGERGLRGSRPDFTKCKSEHFGVVAPGQEWLVGFRPEQDVWTFDPDLNVMFPTMHKPGDPDTILVFGSITYRDHLNANLATPFLFHLKRGSSTEFEAGAVSDYP